MAMYNLKNRVIIITGASSGIGKALAYQLIDEKPKLVLAARSEDKLSAISKDLQQSGIDCLVVPTDVTSTKDVENLIDKTIRHYGKIDVLINNAGMGYYKPILETSFEKVKQLYDLNVFSVLHCIHKAYPHFKAQGYGYIVNISTSLTKITLPIMGIYTSTKWSLQSISEILQLELEKDNIDVTIICPGVTKTEFFNTSGVKTMTKGMTSQMKTPEDVAKKIVKAMKKKKAEVVIGPAKIFMFIKRFLPSFLIRKLLKAIAKKM